MSKPNKANKNNYSQAGRLTPDDMARERMKQGEMSRSKGQENVIGNARSAPGGPAPSRPRTAREGGE